MTDFAKKNAPLAYGLPVVASKNPRKSGGIGTAVIFQSTANFNTNARYTQIGGDIEIAESDAAGKSTKVRKITSRNGVGNFGESHGSEHPAPLIRSVGSWAKS